MTPEEMAHERLAGPRALTFGCLTGIVFWGIVLFGIFFVTRAEAPPLVQPWHWSKTCFTHDDSPQITLALAKWSTVAGVSDCGVARNNPDIRIWPWNDAYPAEQVGNSGAAQSTPGGVPAFCFIAIRPGYESSAHVWLHEVGHCLGLAHNPDPASVMTPTYYPTNATSPQPDDIAGLQSIYGPAAWRRFVLVLAMLRRGADDDQMMAALGKVAQ